MTAPHTARDTQLTCPQCGWTSPPTTPGNAAFSLRRHSCTRHRSSQAAKARKTARENATDRTPKPCHHAIANHQHGTRAAYVLDQCRCPPCAAAAAAYELARYRKAGYGQPTTTLVDAGPARDHIAALRQLGMGKRAIARAAGVNTSTVDRLTGNPSRAQSVRLRPATATALLAVTYLPAPGARVDAAGTRRRVQALVAAGWTLTTLAHHLHRSPGNVSTLAHHQGNITAAKAARVAALYDQLSSTGPPAAGAARARALAERRGWAVAAAWDDIDDPDEHPDTGLPVNGWDLGELLFLIDTGETPARAAARVGVTLETAQTRLRRAKKLTP